MLTMLAALLLARPTMRVGRRVRRWFSPDGYDFDFGVRAIVDDGSQGRWKHGRARVLPGIIELSHRQLVVESFAHGTARKPSGWDAWRLVRGVVIVPLTTATGERFDAVVAKNDLGEIVARIYAVPPANEVSPVDA